MIIKPKEIVVPEEEPFENDALDRKESAEALTEFVLSTNEPLVICIDASWGQGKTTFLRMWRQHLKNSGVHTIYFNAWENDFSDDALVSLIGEISTLLSELDKKTKSKARAKFNKTKRIGMKLLKRSVPVLIKVGTAGALDTDAIIEQELAKFAGSLAKKQIEQYEKSKESVQEFRNTLKEFAASISLEEDKPLVFIIDELDRCRPDYAIEVLEKAKHFFNVDNIIFVLSAYKDQLSSSIKSIYGEKLDSNDYLRRFIDIDYRLPPPDREKFVVALFQKYGFSEYFSQKTGRDHVHEYQEALTMFKDLFELYKLTLREQEHCCLLLSVAIRTTPPDRALFPLFLCFLIVLKIKEQDLYNEFISEELLPPKILEYIRKLHGGNEFLQDDYGARLEAYIISCKLHQYNHDEIRARYRRESGAYPGEEMDRSNRILGIIGEISRGGIRILPYLVEKIEIATRFKS